MHLHAIRIRNFRRLKDVLVDLDKDLSIFVGANNSGKTSTAHAVHLFTKASRAQVSLHDFNTDCWSQINNFGDEAAGALLPKISVDFWFHVEELDVHRVINLLPSLDWEGSLVGLRVEFAAEDEKALLERFQFAWAKAQENVRQATEGVAEYHPPPTNLCDYLGGNLQREFIFCYSVLDQSQFDAEMVEIDGYIPRQLTREKGSGPKEILDSLLSVDFLGAQRHLSDQFGSGRAEDLSKRLSRYYEHNLEKREDDVDAMHALAESESLLNTHLGKVFTPVLDRLARLGYPGVDNPKLVMKSALNPTTILSSQDGAKIHYVLDGQEEGSNGPSLPDSYNGLGYKNLIYIVVELLDIHARWIDIEENRPPVHLIFIEEPEVHLHAQLQQVFIREVLNILPIEGADAAYYHNQLIVTTHSSHILYERGFKPIRYFRRDNTDRGMSSQALNLSAFYDQTEEPINDFLERYLRLTHCDLFFADAAILVEGNVERLLMPQMIEKASPKLKSAYLSILEVGGAFAYRFRSLIEFLGLAALVVTDIDSVVLTEGEGDKKPKKKACMVQVDGAETSNQTLIEWLPGKLLVQDLLNVADADLIQSRTGGSAALVRIAYQGPVNVTWGGVTEKLVGRTLEEAFVFENLSWCQEAGQADVKLRVGKNQEKTLEELAARLHKRIKSSSFKKTDFALAILTKNPDFWNVPSYIVEGLQWLENEVSPLLAVESTLPQSVENNGE